MLRNLRHRPEQFERLSRQHIEKSKLILNAALSRVMKNKSQAEFKQVRSVIFSLLDSSDRALDGLKYVLVEGRFLDAADDLMKLSGRILERQGNYRLKAALIYAPFAPQKALRAFDLSRDSGADISPHYEQIARLHRSVGNRQMAEKFFELIDLVD